MVKALDSRWQSNDRSSSWLKIKPDYSHSQELDCVVLGGYYGSGYKGGKVSQWLMGVRAAVPGGGGGVEGKEERSPYTFISFCRVRAELQCIMVFFISVLLWFLGVCLCAHYDSCRVVFCVHIMLLFAVVMLLFAIVAASPPTRPPTMPALRAVCCRLPCRLAPA